MKKILFASLILLLFSCKKEDIKPSDGSVEYSTPIYGNGYEFIYVHQTVWSGNHSGFPDMPTPSGQGWIVFKKYNSVYYKNTGDPYNGILQIFWREYIIDNTSTPPSGSGWSIDPTYSDPILSKWVREPMILVPADNMLHTESCSASVPGNYINISGCVDNDVFSNKKIYWGI